MNLRKPYYFLVCICLSFVFGTSQAVAQFRVLSFDISQLPQAGGGTEYRLISAYFGYQFSTVPASSATLTQPNGTVLSAIQTTEYASFAELSSALFGDWTITEKPASGPSNNWVVRVVPFALSNVFSATPVITSPTPGSNVPTEFVLKWAPGGLTSSRGLAYSHGPGLEVTSPEFGVDGNFSALFQTELLEPAPQLLSVAATVQTRLATPQIVSRSPTLNSASMSRFAFFNSHSLRAQY